MANVKQIVKKTVYMYDMCRDMCLEAANEIYKGKMASFETKKKVCENVRSKFSRDDMDIRVWGCDDSGDEIAGFQEVGFCMEWKETPYVYVSMYLRYDMDSDKESSFWDLSRIRCETTDSDIMVDFCQMSNGFSGEKNEYITMEVDFPYEKRETYRTDQYAIWGANKTDPHQHHYICDYAISAYDESFDQFYHDYVQQFGHEFGIYVEQGCQ